MGEWFCHVTCLVQTWHFYHKKVVTWKSQHFYHKEVMMLSFLHRWDYCWKCEFDINVKIENYNHHDGEQLLFYKKVHIKMQCEKKDVLVTLYYCKKWRIPIYLIKNVKCHNSTWRKLTWMNRNWTSKLQVSTTITNYYFPLTFPERNCALTLPKPLRKKYLDAFWENEGKIHDGGCVKKLFFIKLQVGISQLHNRLTSLQTVLRDFKQMNAFEWLLLDLV